jgi:hypothetical protein
MIDKDTTREVEVRYLLIKKSGVNSCGEFIHQVIGRSKKYFLIARFTLKVTPKVMTARPPIHAFLFARSSLVNLDDDIIK